MKHFLMVMLCILSVVQVMAQTNLVFFSEGGENFTLFINGERQNAAPASNVKARGINAEQVLILVKFEQSGMPDLKTPMLLEPGVEMTAIIKKNKKGAYVFRPVSAVPIEQGSNDVQSVASSQPAVSQSAPAQPQPAVYSATSTSTTTTASAPSNTSTVDVNVSESMTGVNMNVSIEVNESANQMDVMETATVSSTTTVAEPVYMEPQPSYSPAPSAPAVSNTCSAAMSSGDFESAKKAIANKSFAEDRMTVSKQILKANCLSVKQVKAVMGLFSYEESRLEFAKLAYAKTVDKGNYYQVNDAFSFSGSITELDKFLAEQ